MYYEGQIITTEEHVKFAIWANANGGKFYSEPNGDGTYTVREVVVVEPTIEEQNEAIKHTRASQYATLIDPLHAEKQRKVVLGTWTEEMEAEYVAKVKELSEKIKAENPYIDSVEVLH
jgi:hypothetical protein